MHMINKMEIAKFTSDKIASKLSSYVSQNQKVRVIVFCSCTDQARDRVNLSFLKYFGVVPKEFDNSNGNLAIDTLSEQNDFDGLTIVLDVLSINNHFLKDTAAQRKHYVPVSRIPEQYQRLIDDQSEKISDYFKKYQDQYAGGYVYVSGFSVSMSSAGQDLLPKAEFLPWYLEVNTKPSSSHIVRQPELNLLMQEMMEEEPLIHNLDHHLDEMLNLESEIENL